MKKKEKPFADPNVEVATSTLIENPELMRNKVRAAVRFLQRIRKQSSFSCLCFVGTIGSRSKKTGIAPASRRTGIGLNLVLLSALVLELGIPAFIFYRNKYTRRIELIGPLPERGSSVVYVTDHVFLGRTVSKAIRYMARTRGAIPAAIVALYTPDNIRDKVVIDDRQLPLFAVSRF